MEGSGLGEGCSNLPVYTKKFMCVTTGLNPILCPNLRAKNSSGLNVAPPPSRTDGQQVFNGNPLALLAFIDRFLVKGGP